MRAFARRARGRPKRDAANDNEPDRNGRGASSRDAGSGSRDAGTAELQMKRAQLARGLDPAQCAHPLDLLKARGWVTEAEHRAGWRYAGLYRRVNGRVSVDYGRFYDGFAAGGGVVGEPLDEAELARREARYRRAKADLLAAGDRVARLTEAVSVFGIWPGFVFAVDGRESAACSLLRQGLAALAASFAARPR